MNNGTDEQDRVAGALYREYNAVFGLIATLDARIFGAIELMDQVGRSLKFSDGITYEGDSAISKLRELPSGPELAIALEERRSQREVLAVLGEKIKALSGFPGVGVKMPPVL